MQVGKLSLEETKELLREIVAALPESELFAVLNETLLEEQRQEFGEAWFDMDREDF